ncbi:336_t:CDS:2 [Funneliformis geosporum]|nr:336_t:CDS:2 [Funneliformis geosporum]
MEILGNSTLDKTRGIGLGIAFIVEFDNFHFHITTNKKSYACANYFIIHLQQKRLTWDATVLKESEEFIKRVYKRLLKEPDNLTKALLHLVTQRRGEINNTPLDVSLIPDTLTMFLTVNTDRDLTEQISNVNNTEPMSDEAIVGNLMEAAAGVVDINYRMNTKDEILDGYTILAETQFFITKRTNPEESDPDLFINGQDKNLSFQFGGGTRTFPISHQFCSLLSFIINLT